MSVVKEDVRGNLYLTKLHSFQKKRNEEMDY